MLGIGIVVGLVGYGMAFWGAQLFNGCTTNSFLDIMWPGGQKFVPCSSGSSSLSTTTPNTGGAAGSGVQSPSPWQPGNPYPIH